MLTCPILNKIKRAVTQKYLSYWHHISCESVVPLNRFSIFTNLQLPTWLTTHDARH